MPKKRDTITPKTNSISKWLNSELPRKAYNFFRSKTPKRTGNARSKTRLIGKTIDANYAYAKPLDRGWSRQAPNGMTEPTREYVEALIKQRLRK